MARYKIYNKKKLDAENGPGGNKAFDVASERVYQGNGETLVYAGFLPNKNIWFIQKSDLPGEYQIGNFVPSNGRDTELGKTGRRRKDGYSMFRVLGTLEDVINELNSFHRCSLA